MGRRIHRGHAPDAEERVEPPFRVDRSSNARARSRLLVCETTHGGGRIAFHGSSRPRAPFALAQMERTRCAGIWRARIGALALHAHGVLGGQNAITCRASAGPEVRSV